MFFGGSDLTVKELIIENRQNISAKIKADKQHFIPYVGLPAQFNPRLNVNVIENGYIKRAKDMYREKIIYRITYFRAKT